MLKKILKYIIILLRWWNKLKFDFGTNISIESSFEGANRIGKGCVFNGVMGYGSYIGSNCEISAKIGRFTSIANACSTIIGRHPYSYPFVTTSPMFFSLRKQSGYTFAQKQMYEEVKYVTERIHVEIGSDCWIGYGAKIVGGIKIEDGAIVLAGAVVTKDVPPYAIVGGIPAKIVAYRYDSETIKFLLHIKWWNNSKDWLSKNWVLMCDMNELKKYFGNR